MLIPLWYDFRVITEPMALGIFTPYAIIITGSAGLGIFLSRLLSKGDLPDLINGGIGLALLSLIGSRITYVLFNLGFYVDHLLEIPQLWLGGLSWTGALPGGILAVYLIHLIYKEPPGEIADSYLPLLGTLAVGIWLAGWGAGIGYGPLTEAWFGIPVVDIFGVREVRWPLPIIGSALSGFWTAGAILYPLKRNRPPGTRALAGSAGLVLINGLISFFRVDPAPSWLGLRWESWISIGLLTAAVIGIYLLNKDQIDHERTAA